MRVLFWSDTFWPSIGGVEILAAKLLPALRARGYEFIVVAPKNHKELPDETDYKGIPVYRFPFWRGSGYSIIDHLVEIRQKVIKLKNAFTPDLVHINAVGGGNFFHLTTANADPLLVTLHGEWESRIEPVVGRTLRAADWVVGCSAAILNRGRQLVPEITARSSVIHNGLELPSLAPKPLPFNGARLLCLGRLLSYKGFDLALDAFAKIVAYFPNARLVIVGDGPERRNLEQQIARSKLAGSVELAGLVAPHQVPTLINSATLVLIPSREEAFSLVALEAALMARPVVATRVGGLPEVVLHGQTGLLVDSGNPDALAEAVRFLLADSEVTKRMGQTARNRAMEKFSWNQYVEAYDALYTKLAH
jgi:glycogen synthase